MECQLKDITKKEEDIFRELLVDGEHPLSSIIHSVKNEIFRQNISKVSMTKVNPFKQQDKFDIAVDIVDCNFCKLKHHAKFRTNIVGLASYNYKL